MSFISLDNIYSRLSKEKAKNQNYFNRILFDRFNEDWNNLILKESIKV